MARRDRAIRTGLIMFALFLGGISVNAAATPMDEVKETIGRILGILQGPLVAEGSDIARRRELLREAIAPRFDFLEMARRSLGSHWNREPGRRQEFVSVFSDFVEYSYVSKIESLKETKIIFVREHVDRGFAQVETRMIPNKGDDIPVLYRLHLVEDAWKIYDVVVENISLVENYRSQFNRILSIATFDDLVKKLQQKISAGGG